MDANPKSHQTSLSDHPQGRRWCRNNAVFNESAIKALEVIATCAKTEFAASFSWPATPDFDNPAYIVCLVVSDFFYIFKHYSEWSELPTPFGSVQTTDSDSYTEPPGSLRWETIPQRISSPRASEQAASQQPTLGLFLYFIYSYRQQI